MPWSSPGTKHCGCADWSLMVRCKVHSVLLHLNNSSYYGHIRLMMLVGVWLVNMMLTVASVDGVKCITKEQWTKTIDGKLPKACAKAVCKQDSYFFCGKAYLSKSSVKRVLLTSPSCVPHLPVEVTNGSSVRGTPSAGKCMELDKQWMKCHSHTWRVSSLWGISKKLKHVVQWKAETVQHAFMSYITKKSQHDSEVQNSLLNLSNGCFSNNYLSCKLLHYTAQNVKECSLYSRFWQYCVISTFLFFTELGYESIQGYFQEATWVQ